MFWALEAAARRHPNSSKPAAKNSHASDMH